MIFGDLVRKTLRSRVIGCFILTAATCLVVTACGGSADEGLTDDSEVTSEQDQQSTQVDAEESAEAIDEGLTEDSEVTSEQDQQSTQVDAEESAEPVDEGLTEEPEVTSEQDQESSQANQEFAALSDIDQALVIGLNTYEWDTQPWVSADIESIDVPEGTDFSVTLTLENFTESPIFALACDATFVWEFFTAAVAAGNMLCSPPVVTTFDNDGDALITATSTGEGACWGVGGMGSEIGFICIPFGDLDGYSSADCADSELGEGFLFPLSDGVLWCNYGEVSRPLDANE